MGIIIPLDMAYAYRDSVCGGHVCQVVDMSSQWWCIYYVTDGHAMTVVGTLCQ